jgi:hypothetical protein
VIFQTFFDQAGSCRTKNLQHEHLQTISRDNGGGCGGGGGIPKIKQKQEV